MQHWNRLFRKQLQMVVLRSVRTWLDKATADLILVLATFLWEVGLERDIHSSPMTKSSDSSQIGFCFFFLIIFPLYFFHLLRVALNALKYYFLMHVLIIHSFSIHHSLVICFSIPCFI